MKRFLIYIPVAILAAASCSGTIDENDKTQDAPEEYAEPFTLTADKTEVEASGRDTVTFTLTDAYGRDILADRNALQNVNIVAEDGARVKRMTRTATYFRNGTFIYKATFKGVESENTVTVEAKNRGKYETYFRKVGLFKCTSVWCSACPSLARSLHTLSEEMKEHSVVLACHGDFNNNDPFSLYVDGTDLGTYMMSYIGGNAWPTLIYDLSMSKTGAAPASDIEEIIMTRRAESPATCGISISSVSVEGKDLKVKAAMKTSTGGKYDLACAVLRDGLSYQADGVFSMNSDGIFDEVVVNLTPNFIRYSTQTGKELAKDEEWSKEFAFSFGDAVPSEADLASFRVVVYAHRATETGSTMDNIAECTYGKSVDYKLND